MDAEGSALVREKVEEMLASIARAEQWGEYKLTITVARNLITDVTYQPGGEIRVRPKRQLKIAAVA